MLNKETLKNKLSSGKEKEVLNALIQLADKDNELINKLHLHRKKLKSLKNRHNLGTISDDYVDSETNNIYLALFELIDKIFQ
jgi:predicted small metal-binding protein